MAETPLFIRACRREPVERTPIWIMRQAGRYLPEYRALREKADFLTSCRTPELACEITLQPVSRLGVDAAILFSDILIPAEGMGVSVDFNPGPVLANPVRDRAGVDALRTPDAREATPYVLDAVRLIRRELAGRVPLIGFAGAPFTFAAYLVEGGGSKSFERLKRMIFSEPALATALMEKCTATIASYVIEQARAGAEAIMLFDTWAGMLAPADAAEWAVSWARRVFAAMGEAGVAVPRIYYAGEAAGWLESARASGADVIGIDWRIDLAEARRRLGPSLAVQGNLDPGVLLGPPALIERRAAEVLASAGMGEGRGPAAGHIFNLGHGILQQTPPEHALHLVDCVRRLSGRVTA